MSSGPDVSSMIRAGGVLQDAGLMEADRFEQERLPWMVAYGLPAGWTGRARSAGEAVGARVVPVDQLNRLARTAATVCDAPFAVVNVITADEQHQIAAHGLEPGICSREDSMCAQVFRSGTTTVVPDASVDARFRGNPFVTGALGDVRFYVSVPLVAEVALGSLCVFSPYPATLEPKDQAVLESLAEHVTDVLQLQFRGRQLDAALAEAALSNERLKTFAGEISHDLRTPLTTILGHLEIAEDQTADERVAGNLRKASGAGKRMLATLEELLEYSTTSQRLEARELDLSALTDKVTADIRGLVSQSGARITSSGGSVRGDDAQLRALAQNLLVNAIRYCPADRLPRIRIEAVTEPGMSGMVVHDNGLGIPTADRARVLAPLGRLNRAGEPQGTGLGLAICARVAQAHGGTITIGDSPDGGAAITASWPVRS
ncbi:GAF domain-containing sensor histidine kinase [Arthrobacter sp. Marseille-P9274]|uniref:GAF domain-containing sensor histidine kinase n=1 Tax=Arthrobacter sp. Marseille-P9274 TaxID=2866572 RepID=UPI0021C78BFB|nr:GAF domain-containing sensor histidine kinase [Arthrobacter sp. Marseille-P9274]